MDSIALRRLDICDPAACAEFKSLYAELEARLNEMRKIKKESGAIALDSSDHHFFIEAPAGEIVGFAICSQCGMGFEIKKLFIKKDSRGKGIGRAVLAKLEEIAKTLGFSKIFLSVLKSNSRAAKLYEDCGFEVRRLGMAKFLD
jgi:ribosomal protein S18 acetylase RimI-like enzyme